MLKYLKIAIRGAFEGAIYDLHEELEAEHRERSNRIVFHDERTIYSDAASPFRSLFNR